MSSEVARVRLVERQDVPEEARAAYDHVAGTRGQMGNSFKAMANSPGALEKVAAVGEFIRSGSTLSRGLQELVILTVAHEAGSFYQWAGHMQFLERLGERMGISRAQLDMAGTAALEQEPAPVGPAVRYARLLARGSEIDEGLTLTLRDALGDAGLVELTICAGYYLLLGRFTNSLAIPLDDSMIGARPFPNKATG